MCIQALFAYTLFLNMLCYMQDDGWLADHFLLIVGSYSNPGSFSISINKVL